MMKKLCGLLLFASVHASELFNLNFNDSNTIELGIGVEKSAEIRILKTRYASLEKQQEDFWKSSQLRIDTVKQEIRHCELELDQASHDERSFLDSKLLILRGIKQVVGTLKATWKEMLATLKQHIQYLEDYSQDPYFKNLLLEIKSVYTLSDLESLNESILATEEKIASLITDKNQLQLNLDRRKKRYAMLVREFNLLSKEQKEFALAVKTGAGYSGPQLRESGALFDVKLESLFFEKELASLYVQEEETFIGFKGSQIEIEQKKLEALKRKQEILTQDSLKIDEQDVTVAHEAEGQAKRAYLHFVEQYSSHIEEMLEEKERTYQEFTKTQNAYKHFFENGIVSIEWIEVPKTIDALKAIATLGLLQEQLALLDRKIEQFRAQIELEKMTYNQQQWNAAIVESWHMIKNQLFQSNKELERDLERFQDISKELMQEKVVTEDKRKAAVAKLNVYNKYYANIKNFVNEISKTKNKFGFFGDSAGIIQQLHTTEGIIQQEIDIIGKLVEYYSQIIVTISKSIQKNHVMSQELQKFSLWHRSGRAITKSGLKNIIPNLKMFVIDFYLLAEGYFSILTDKSLMTALIKSSVTPYSAIVLLAQLLGLIFLLLLFQWVIPYAIFFCERIGDEHSGIYKLSLLSALCLRFINYHSTGLLIWIVCYAIFGYGIILDFSSVVFFLLSIPYFLYLSHSFVQMFQEYTIKHDYPFCSPDASLRLQTFLIWFLGASAVVFFFREAFILATYKRCELPDILLAFYSAFVRILLLFLVRKEDIIGLLPLKSTWGIRSARFIERYYYFLLLLSITVMVLMDPNIGGYNNLVHYVVWGMLLSFVMIKGLLFLYAFLRRSSAYLFFTETNNTLEERFTFARSCYAFSIMSLFFSLLVVGFLMLAWIWGKPVSLGSVFDFFMTERLTIGSGSSLQKLSLFHVFKIFLFIPFAFSVALIVDRFVITRFFSILYVSPGVQNAVSTISYYIIIITVLILGLLSEGLGYVIAIAIAPVVLSAAWAFREIFNDFVAYFVILIQRPIKVGDYIKIDEETCGVVRNITPRTVVLRRKRGFCIIIPNSRILRDTVTNWDYNLNYISCPDIQVTIAFRENPQEVINLLAKTIVTVPSVLKSPPPVLRLEEFSEIGYTVLIRVFTGPEKTLLQWDISSDVRLAVVKTLRDNNIKIAAPVRFIEHYPLYTGETEGTRKD